MSRGWINVAPENLGGPELERWVSIAVAHNRSNAACRSDCTAVAPAGRVGLSGTEEATLATPRGRGS